MKGACLSALLILIGNIASADPIQSEVAITVPEGATTLRSFIRGTNGTGRSPDVLEWRTQLVYGMETKRNLLVSVPVVSTAAERAGRERSTFGLGDISLLVKQQIWGRNRLQTQDRIAVIGGLELPTGATSQTDRFGPVPRSMQPGSGSWDFPVGILLAHDAPTGYFADVLYTARSGAGGYRTGNSFRYDLALTRALRGGEPKQHFVWGVLELNGYVNGRDRADSRVASTGGHVLYLSPGVRLVHWTGRWVVDLSYQLPIAYSLNDRQARPGGAWLLGIRANF